MFVHRKWTKEELARWKYLEELWLRINSSSLVDSRFCGLEFKSTDRIQYDNAKNYRSVLWMRIDACFLEVLHYCFAMNFTQKKKTFVTLKFRLSFRLNPQQKIE